MNEFTRRAVMESIIYILQVLEWINTVQLAGLDQGIIKSRPLPAMRITGEQGVSPFPEPHLLAAIDFDGIHPELLYGLPHPA